MKATTLNTIFWIAAAITLNVYSMTQGWDAVCSISSALGYSILCFAAWLGIDGFLNRGNVQ